MRALLRNGKLPRPRLDVEEYVRTRSHGHAEWAGNGLRVLGILFPFRSKIDTERPIEARYANETRDRREGGGDRGGVLSAGEEAALGGSPDDGIAITSAT